MRGMVQGVGCRGIGCSGDQEVHAVLGVRLGETRRGHSSDP